MNELDKYREQIDRRYHTRRGKTRHKNDGRRDADYKQPRFWTWGFIVQVFTLILGGLVALVLLGCVAIKKSLGG